VPLRHRIESHPETVQDFERACGEKLWEGIELLVAGHLGGGIYLLGYTAEIVLKNACFLFDGARPGDDVNSRLRPIPTWARHHGITVNPEGYHSYVIWDKWRGLSQLDRSEIIMDVAENLSGDKMLPDISLITVAMGLTPEEAKRMRIKAS
jgi:hypothetical protein